MTNVTRRLFACATALSLAAAILMSQASLTKAEELIRCAYPYWFGFAPVPSFVRAALVCWQGAGFCA